MLDLNFHQVKEIIHLYFSAQLRKRGGSRGRPKAKNNVIVEKTKTIIIDWISVHLATKLTATWEKTNEQDFVSFYNYFSLCAYREIESILPEKIPPIDYEKLMKFIFDSTIEFITFYGLKPNFMEQYEIIVTTAQSLSTNHGISLEQVFNNQVYFDVITRKLFTKEEYAEYFQRKKQLVLIFTKKAFALLEEMQLLEDEISEPDILATTFIWMHLKSLKIIIFALLPFTLKKFNKLQEQEIKRIYA